MRILIAPDKFKGSLSAREVADSIAAGLRDVLPDARIDIVPMADGGEGTADVICDGLAGEWVTTRAHDPLGREIETRYAWIDRQKLAVMEMSEAAGMRRLSESERDPLGANTFGVGEMIFAAAKLGAEEIVIGLGGSATNDGGLGMARALGFKFDYEHEHEHEHEKMGVSDLAQLAHITAPSPRSSPLGRGGHRPRVSWESGSEAVGEAPGEGKIAAAGMWRALSLPKIIAAADVRNPLLGENGATRVFGAQKGATEDQIQILELALTKLADVVSKEFDVDYRDEPGAGAAGGLGFGLMSFCGAKTRPGFEVVAEAVDLESRMKDVDVVITGEGSLDRQTLEGKTPAGVARLALRHGKRVFAIVGRASEDREVREMFDDVLELGGSIPQGRELLRERARQLAETLTSVE